MDKTKETKVEYFTELGNNAIPIEDFKNSNLNALDELEKQFWKIQNIIDWDDKLLQSKSWQQNIQMAKAAASLCREKIREDRAKVIALINKNLAEL